MDEGGDLITDYVHDVYKVRLDAEGKQIDVEKAKGIPPQMSSFSL